VAAATTTETRQQFGREMRLSANLECETAYILPTPFVIGGVPNRDKSPFSPELCYDPKLKAPILSRVVLQPVTKEVFA
jgi:hypothetical protein